MPDYSDYSLQDFLHDDHFVRWVIAADTDIHDFWLAFLVEYPEKQIVLNKAADIIRAYRKQEVFTHEERREAVWKRIHATLQTQPTTHSRIIRLTPAMKVAAMLMLFSAVGLLLWQLTTRNQTITTAYGEVKMITLPDLSVVVLNGNSSLSYRANWDANSPREVWIEGEGYFDVKHLNADTNHIATAERFIVHSQEMDIEVLGTSFDVKNRRGKTDVGLLSGKVKIKPADQAGQASNGLVLQPGDYVKYANRQLVEKKKLRKPGLITTWTRNEITFDNAYLKEITEKLQDEFGYSVEVKDQDLMTVRIEGEISVANVPELLSAIATTLDLKIVHTNKNIIISRN